MLKIGNELKNQNFRVLCVCLFIYYVLSFLQVSLPKGQTNVYQFQLKACDNIQDHDRNCRFLEDSYFMIVAPQIEYVHGTRFYVESASAKTDYKWQHNLQNNHKCRTSYQPGLEKPIYQPDAS